MPAINILPLLDYVNKQTETQWMNRDILTGSSGQTLLWSEFMWEMSKSNLSKTQIPAAIGVKSALKQDEVAEWLRRWTANPLCSARVGSNPILVG